MKVYMLLADGFEESEAIIPYDVLKRARIEVSLVSIYDHKNVTSSHGVEIVAHETLASADLSDGDLLFLPGGMPGTLNLEDCEGVKAAVKQYHEEGKWLAAICAAPSIFGHMGLLEGKKATCYPHFDDQLLGAEVCHKTCVRDGKFITGCGAGAGFAIGKEMVSVLVSENTAEAVLRQMMFQVYE